ncbi:hypothetical protein JM946_02390 [Steroidobacter sp. S1-65]|uniref:DUF4190 domain-containing protein n=1 Tax=Steroidobacter gossypii TaxID=2805490 RepID=A0ABS1WRH2_9GAMM|nr:hypothetical protein [Steroidobacter gossypii]MBM0103569.1 hypothetical protein [Steroidobacter gossypii]
MTSQPADSPDAVRTGFGWKLKLALLLPSALVLASIVASFFIFSYYIDTAFLVASAVALVVATTAMVMLIRRPALRLIGSIIVTVLAVMASLPAFLLLVFVVYMIVPVTPWEREAISTAETFVERNGYTAAGHPKGLPVLANDIMDFGPADEIAQSRRNAVQPRAVGIVGVPGFGYSVLFEYTRPPPRINDMPRSLFVVQIEADGKARKPHLMPTYPDWWYKKNER